MFSKTFAYYLIFTIAAPSAILNIIAAAQSPPYQYQILQYKKEGQILYLFEVYLNRTVKVAPTG